MNFKHLIIYLLVIFVQTNALDKKTFVSGDVSLEECLPDYAWKKHLKDTGQIGTQIAFLLNYPSKVSYQEIEGYLVVSEKGISFKTTFFKNVVLDGRKGLKNYFSKSITIPITNVLAVKKRFIGPGKLEPYGISITTKDGHKYKFVTKDKDMDPLFDFIHQQITQNDVARDQK